MFYLTERITGKSHLESFHKKYFKTKKSLSALASKPIRSQMNRMKLKYFAQSLPHYQKMTPLPPSVQEAGK